MNTYSRFSTAIAFALVATLATLAGCKGDIACGGPDDFDPGAASASQALSIDAAAPDAATADGGADAPIDHTGDPAYDVSAACRALTCVAPDTCIVHSSVPGAIEVVCGRGPC
jgi:hypothetical protein